VLHSTRPTDGEDITIRVKLVKVLPHASCAQLYNVVFRRYVTYNQKLQIATPDMMVLPVRITSQGREGLVLNLDDVLPT